jgi:hypothetical protein
LFGKLSSGEIFFTDLDGWRYKDKNYEFEADSQTLEVI